MVLAWELCAQVAQVKARGGSTTCLLDTCRASAPCGGLQMACWLRSPLLANLLKLFSISAFRMYGLMCKSHGIDSGLLLEREHTLGNAWEQWDHLRKVLMYGVNSPLYLLKFHAEMVPVPGTVHGERRTIVPK